MGTKLTLKDRYNLSMYARKLPSTILLRLTIADFLKQIEFTSDEMSKYEIKVDPITYEFLCNDELYVVDYEVFPPSVIKAMQTYIQTYDHEKNKDSVLLQNMIKTFRLVV